MTFHPKLDYREAHRSTRKMPYDDGHVFVYEPENRARFEEIAKRYPPDGRKSAILPALFLVQRQLGYISLSSMQHVASVIGCTAADVEDVVSFYTMFYTQPVGKYVVQVCRTLPCALRGAGDVLHHCEKRLGIKPGETTSDGKITLRTAECLASCGTAPMMQVDKTYHENLTLPQVDAILDRLQKA
jgi:NADH-quinone oxidoreductase subunit E